MDNTTATRQWTDWFEIPVLDFDRAKTFYETIFDTTIEVLDLGNITMGMFPHKNVGCAICKNEFYKPSENGILVYMNADPDLQIIADRIESAGGKIVFGKKQISPEHGYMCIFIDSEGNRLGLHSTE